MKYKRHSKILNIISNKEVQTQEMILDELKNDGYNVTQATVSRDIKELGLIKIPSADGTYKYAQPKTTPNEPDKHISMLSDVVKSIDFALHTIVIKTFPGMAPAVAASLDSTIENEILGSIAGDDTIFLICENQDKAQILTGKLNRMFGLYK